LIFPTTSTHEGLTRHAFPTAGFQLSASDELERSVERIFAAAGKPGLTGYRGDDRRVLREIGCVRAN
jgi:hypothetical protein